MILTRNSQQYLHPTPIMHSEINSHPATQDLHGLGQEADLKVKTRDQDREGT